MDFDARPGLKYLIRYVCQSSVPPNLSQLSSLVWSLQFVLHQFLCSSLSKRGESADDSLAALEELFSEISAVYVGKCARLHQLSSQVDDETKRDDVPTLIRPLAGESDLGRRALQPPNPAISNDLDLALFARLGAQDLPAGLVRPSGANVARLPKNEANEAAVEQWKQSSLVAGEDRPWFVRH